ncbi:uncharacterized protein LOC128233016 [Mya arenaria]|uniref:uncharacterized protein LOC128233016 n=1 Tax=Mya arenaria TaxID=6604 RepID=UPI0022E2E777|nr:uncharacterized protein LOC128233016 [Mya arenaria]
MLQIVKNAPSIKPNFKPATKMRRSRESQKMGGGGTKTAQNGPDNSLLTLLANVGIVVLVILNILSLLLGVGIIIVGKYVDSEINKNENVMELLELVDFGDFNLRTLVDVLIIIIFIVGAFAIVLSLIGGIGAFFTLRVLLFLYIGIILLVIIVEIAVVSLWVKLFREVDYALESLLLDLLKEYTGFSDITVYTVGWDFIFILFDCCGVHPITASSNDFETLPSAFWSNGDRGSDVIPHACCKDVAVKNYLNYTNTDCTVNLQGYHTSGCYDAFDRIFNQLGSAAVSVASLLVLAELGAIFFSVIIIIAVFKKKRAGLV